MQTKILQIKIRFIKILMDYNNIHMQLIITITNHKSNVAYTKLRKNFDYLLVRGPRPRAFRFFCGKNPTIDEVSPPIANIEEISGRGARRATSTIKFWHPIILNKQNYLHTIPKGNAYVSFFVFCFSYKICKQIPDFKSTTNS